jgi:hypothetical protein
MLLAYRLVRLIETHSEQLADGLLERLQSDPKCYPYGGVPSEEFRQAAIEIYQRLGDWLLGKGEEEVGRRYREIGHRRAQQGVSLPQLIWAIALTKENLIEFLQRQTSESKPVEILGELEVVNALERFFDHAMYYSALGHEQGLSAGAAASAGGAPPS